MDQFNKLIYSDRLPSFNFLFGVRSVQIHMQTTDLTNFTGLSGKEKIGFVVRLSRLLTKSELESVIRELHTLPLHNSAVCVPTPTASPFVSSVQPFFLNSSNLDNMGNYAADRLISATTSQSRPSTPLEAIAMADWSHHKKNISTAKSQWTDYHSFSPADSRCFSPQNPPIKTMHSTDRISTNVQHQPTGGNIVTNSTFHPTPTRPFSPVSRIKQTPTPPNLNHDHNFHKLSLSDRSYEIKNINYYPSPQSSRESSIDSREGYTTTTTTTNSPPLNDLSHDIKIEIDYSIVHDIPRWLKSLRLHKYAPILSHLKFVDLVQMNDLDLQGAGVQALGARRKMMKVFEQVKLDIHLRDK